MDMQFRGTSAPWIADNNEGFGAWTIWSRMTPSGHGEAGPIVAQVIGDSSEADANAALIAAGPDLLAVTQGFRQKLATYVSVYPGDKELRSLLADCDAAISKALGAQA